MKNMNEEIKKVNGAQELDDDMLDGVAGGLVQLVNPSSGGRHYFYDGTVCQHCGHPSGSPDVKGRPLKYYAYIICDKCGQRMVDRKVSDSELRCQGGSRM